MGCKSNFLFSISLDLFGGLLREFLYLPHHVDFCVTLRVRL
jgi:hypothetical protein